MRRELLLMRHGKSDWSVAADDFHRPLKERGKRGAQRMGAWLAQEALVPDAILSSPALRARATAEKCVKSMGLGVDMIELKPALYCEGEAPLLKTVRACPDSVQRLMIIGHNPALEDALVWLTGKRPRPPKETKLLPTAAVVKLTFEGRWEDLRSGQMSLELIQRVRALPDGFPWPFPAGEERRERPAYYYRQSAVLPCRLQGEGDDAQWEVLLIGSSSNRHWSLPKGIVEPGMSPLESALKEAREEAGIEAEALDHAALEFSYEKWGAPVAASLHAVRVVHEQEESEREEPHRSRRWVAAEVVPSLLRNHEMGHAAMALLARLEQSRQAT
ncbi:NUDIX domain-containing protein [Cobetia sp. 1CM21F]|uniref:NUDIX domain-containing protein n=1 Tax=Cobetia sp. 1CM21F TaxID=2929163 RepID=UPI0020C09F70|nr:NUDIX domain-containing protein [Cobetia sp. 1CM21F]MCK8067583.1 histidine phosphatase family protein [Cobetia sp. 1CM21F]